MNERARIREAMAGRPLWGRPAMVLQLAVRRFLADGCMHRAAAISYSTVLSLVPLLAVGLMFIAYFGQLEEFEANVQSRVIEFVFPFSSEALPASPARPPAGGAPQAASPFHFPDELVLDATSEAAREVREHTQNRLAGVINNYLREFVANARNLGLFGGLFFIVFAMMLVVAVEEAFNAVWRSARRTWYSRVLNYWAMLSLAPVFLMASLVLTSRVTAESPAWVTVVLPVVVSFLGFWILFMVMPAARVAVWAAALGALVTTLLWELAKHAFAWYMARYTGLQNIYGSLFVVPIVLTWVYYTWLVVLFGVEVSAVLHQAFGRVAPARSGNGEGFMLDRETLEEMRRMRERIDEILGRPGAGPPSASSRD